MRRRFAQAPRIETARPKHVRARPASRNWRNLQGRGLSDRGVVGGRCMIGEGVEPTIEGVGAIGEVAAWSFLSRKKRSQTPSDARPKATDEGERLGGRRGQEFPDPSRVAPAPAPAPASARPLIHCRGRSFRARRITDFPARCIAFPTATSGPAVTRRCAWAVGSRLPPPASSSAQVESST